MCNMQSRALYTNYYAYRDLFEDVKYYKPGAVSTDELLHNVKGQSHKFSVNAIEPKIVARIYSSGHSVFGFNSRKSHPLQKLYGLNEHKIFLHAEIDCIIRASRLKYINLQEAYMDILRWTKNDKPAPSFPCDGCFRAIKATGILSISFFDLEGNYKTLSMEKVK